MRRIKWGLIIFILLFSCLTFFAGGLTAFCCYKDRIYPQSMIVEEINEATDSVFLRDFNGNLWSFKGVEDWMVGDICACIMDSQNTISIKDDTIEKIQYCGFIKGE